MTKYEYYKNDMGVIYNGDSLDVLKKLPSETVQTVITSPPYWGLRDYQVNGQIGLEPTIDEYISKLVKIFKEVYRVLRKEGTLWLNMGDCYVRSSKGIGSNHGKAVYDDKHIKKTDWSKINLKKKTFVASPGGLPLLCKMQAGISDKILSGISQTPCLNQSKTDLLNHMNIYF